MEDNAMTTCIAEIRCWHCTSQYPNSHRYYCTWRVSARVHEQPTTLTVPS